MHILTLIIFYAPYHKWAKANNFNSMLPENTKVCCAKVLEENIHQMNVDDHFKPAPKEEKPDPYSDELFKEAAIEWLIKTNQVCTRHILFD